MVAQDTPDASAKQARLYRTTIGSLRSGRWEGAEEEGVGREVSALPTHRRNVVRHQSHNQEGEPPREPNQHMDENVRVSVTVPAHQAEDRPHTPVTRKRSTFKKTLLRG